MMMPPPRPPPTTTRMDNMIPMCLPCYSLIPHTEITGYCDNVDTVKYINENKKP